MPNREQRAHQEQLVSAPHDNDETQNTHNDVVNQHVQHTDDRFLDTQFTFEEIEHAISSSRALSLKSIGNTSVTFRMRLSGTIQAAWKPQTSTHPNGFRAEVAAYRIGRALGYTMITPAVLRSMHIDESSRLLSSSDRGIWPALSHRMTTNNDKIVQGVAIFWIPNMQDPRLEDHTSRWSPWLKQEEPFPYEHQALARDLSNTIVFDYLIGNWDRWSGGNLQGPPNGQRIYLRDHNLAFYHPLNASFHERILHSLMKVERFSKQTIDALIDLSATRLEEIMTQNESNIQLLNGVETQDVLDRRATILSHVESLVQQYGRQKVLSFE